jgi:hypothetical protein
MHNLGLMDTCYSGVWKFCVDSTAAFPQVENNILTLEMSFLVINTYIALNIESVKFACNTHPISLLGVGVYFNQVDTAT